MDIYKIHEKYDNGDYTYKADIPKKVWDDYIFDEELSVKRNREMAREHNQRVDELRTEAQKQQNLLHWQLTADVINYIQENYNLNEVQVRTVERFVYQEYHSSMYDYFANIDAYAEFACKILGLEDSND